MRPRKAGYWRGKFVPAKPGLYTVAHTLDRIVNHGKSVRPIKSAKTCFVLSARLDQAPLENLGFDRALGHPLKLVPILNPVTPMGPDKPLEVRVGFKGKPLPYTVLSFMPKTGNQYLVVVHHLAKEEATADYQKTAYAATLTVFVPEVCPCCDD